ncbi:MAG: class SAM-dependent methyltransferase [Candidatus Saccharibacteria bacterium]|nr:class SAM-dependent methyltransferase [Candidatus Saccharibacteria bacterium]
MEKTTEPIPSPKKADYYDDSSYNYRDYWDGREYENAAEKMAINRLLSGKRFHRAVDIGGGYGRLTILLKNYADKVTLAEPSRQQLELAQKALKDYPDIDSRQMQADCLDFADGSVDLVAMIRVMHHLPDPTAELAEIARILSKDGYAVIEAANYSHARNRLRHLVRHKKMPVHPVDIRSEDNKRGDEIPFVNHNPRTVIKQLSHAGLKVERILSVSNLRSSGIKKLMPKRVMLAIEGLLQPTLAHGYFGPSVFFLVRKDT